MPDGHMRALEELKRAGDIKAIGIGINTDTALEVTAPRVPVDFCLVAMPYTLLDQASLHVGMARCVRDGVSVIIGSPFASGILATGSNSTAQHYAYRAVPPDVQERVAGSKLCVRVTTCHWSRPLCNSFSPTRPSSPWSPGAARPHEVSQNVEALAVPIPDACWAELRQEGLILADAPVPSAQQMVG
jgi:D-threo-aldose 1-dehydrogenase